MDLSTKYMGIQLKNPIIVSSSSITNNVNQIKECADNGAGAIVLKSLFEEQLLANAYKLHEQDEKYFWFPESIDYISSHSKDFGVKEYLKLIENAKKSTGIPVIASVNCITPYEWPKFVKDFENAGADGIELNIAKIPFDETMDNREIEAIYVQVLKEVKANVKLPVSVKLGALFTNAIKMVNDLCKSGADAVVLFNRFYRPDIDINKEKVVYGEGYSSPVEMGQSLRWISILSGKVKCDLAANTGIHDYQGVVKQILAGATAVQICSTLYLNEISYLKQMISHLEDWMSSKNYNSLRDFRGKISQDYKNVVTFERVQFMKRDFEE